MKRWLFVCLIFLLYLAPPAHGALSLEPLLQPYQWLDLSFVYDKYGTMIDLLVYTLIFVGAAQASLGQKFPGNGGRAMGVGAGRALAFGMVMAERQWGFSLASFGPAGAGMLGLVAGIMIYRLLRYAGMSRHRSAAAACLAVLITLFMMAPGLLDWLHGAAPHMDGLLLPLLALCLTFLFWPRGTLLAERHGPGRSYRHALGNDPLRLWTRNGLGKDKRLLRRALRPRTRDIGRHLHDVGGDLDSVENALRRGGPDPEAVSRMISRLEAASPKVEEIAKAAEEMKGMLEQMKQMDRALFSEHGHESGKKQNPRERRLWEKEIKDERLRLEEE